MCSSWCGVATRPATRPWPTSTGTSFCCWAGSRTTAWSFEGQSTNMSRRLCSTCSQAPRLTPIRCSFGSSGQMWSGCWTGLPGTADRSGQIPAEGGVRLQPSPTDCLPAWRQVPRLSYHHPVKATDRADACSRTQVFRLPSHGRHSRDALRRIVRRRGLKVVRCTPIVGWT